MRKHYIPALFGLLTIASTAFPSDKSKDADALFARAKHLSDIRASGSPAFLLKGEFTISRDPNHPLRGSYTEVWASTTLVRVEISTEGFHRIIVTQDRKRWELNDGEEMKDAITAANMIAHRVDDFSLDSRGAAKVLDRDNNSFALRCVEGHEDDYGGRQEYCFDKSSGKLVAWSLPLAVKGGESDSRCAFADFQQVGDKTFPRTIRCMEGDKQVFETTVTQLLLQQPDPSSFEPPPGAKEFANCPVKLQHPVAVDTPEPEARLNAGPVVLSVVITKEGKTSEIKVNTSAGTEMDNAAVEAVRRWRFKPASCAGEPVESRIDIEVSSRIQ